jgi:rhamnose utilization protein RhaD (predicted bifunctional aldolase and dehydrogenase)
MARLLKETAGQINAYCARVGADPLLVQGAGGNVSWKDGNTLWVKASGTWLADAETKDIFVPVDLPHLLDALAAGDFSVTPRVLGDSSLRPSIETLLHGLMPHHVVVHLHAIEALAYLVRKNFRADFERLLDDSISWAVVDYHKPGAALAAEINAVLIGKLGANVIFLGNHGVVIGGEDLSEVDRIVVKLIQAFKTTPADIHSASRLISPPPQHLIGQYAEIADPAIHQLALKPDFFKRLRMDWALYPDHVVFLGPKAHTYRSWKDLEDQKSFFSDLPELVFVQGEGVFAHDAFKNNKAKQVQLRCYLDVIARQRPDAVMRVLSDAHIAELLNWDAEQYRISLAKTETPKGMFGRALAYKNSLMGFALEQQTQFIEVLTPHLEMLQIIV